MNPAYFSDLMAELGPFEEQPTLAVAVSGGADSLALALLADEWARACGGRAFALTVDHGLRAGSMDEARRVGVWLAARGIEHHILSWRPDGLISGLQAAARQARYRLLGDWCRRNHVLHLLLAHHQDDQAETLMQRLARGSGVDGLAAMAPRSARDDLQILRPLLDVPRRDLRDWLLVQGQEWIEDPSNRAERFDRVMWRKRLVGEKISADRLALTARQMGRARQALEADCALLAVEAAIVSAAGYVRLDPEPLRRAHSEILLRLLAAICRTVGGGLFPPRLDSLERLSGAVLSASPRRHTIAGCVFSPKDGHIFVYREARAVAGQAPLVAGQELLWDNRFLMRVYGVGKFFLRALGSDVTKYMQEQAERAGIPKMVLPTLPAIVDKRGILAIPPLGYVSTESGLSIDRWGFAPQYPLVGAGFRLVKVPARTI